MDINRFKNPSTIIAIASLIALILVRFGFPIDVEWVDGTIKLICCLGVVIGILNSPDTPKINLGIEPPRKEDNDK